MARDKELIKRRDRAIVERFYKEYDIKRRRLDDVLRDLSENHFFLSPDYIYSIVFYDKDNNNYYNELILKEKK